MRELESSFGLDAIRKHGFMANWAWLLLVCLAHKLCYWTQQPVTSGAGRDEAGLRAKRLRCHYLVVAAIVLSGARRLTVRLPESYPFLDRVVATLDRLRALPVPAS